MPTKILVVLGTIVCMLCISLVATAQEDEELAAEATANAEEGGLSTNQAERGKFVALAIGLGLGIAALGGALGQGRATATVLEGLSRNPGAYDKVFTPFILGMVLIESLVIYSLVISLLLLGKV